MRFLAVCEIAAESRHCVRPAHLGNIRDRRDPLCHGELTTMSSLALMGPFDPADTRCAVSLHPVIRHRSDRGWSTFHFGDSLLARWDRPHGAGGAVMSYHHALQTWADERLGLGLEPPTPTGTGAYRKWTAEEIERHCAEHPDDTADKPCRLPS